MNYATIKKYDIANGPGVRVSLYVSGCRNHCKNCFNPETWDFNFGKPFTEEVEDEIIKAMEPDYIEGFTLLGGDPFEPENQVALVPFLERLKKIYPDKSFWCFTGYDYEAELLTGKQGNFDDVIRILNCLDVLVDGRFVENLKDLNLRFRGSSNQRIILVKPSLEQDELILWDEKTKV
ncbi:MAG: anaerobic ribonucleoside-triphosphate reductase activating protein [Clostridiales bacterium]|nr:anaerobic ribonucleoside-triphosphate reductase activating protein [Clostridiales bacterium]